MERSKEDQRAEMAMSIMHSHAGDTDESAKEHGDSRLKKGLRGSESKLLLHITHICFPTPTPFSSRVLVTYKPAPVHLAPDTGPKANSSHLRAHRHTRMRAHT